MLSKLKQLGLYLVFITLAMVWLITSSRRAGKKAEQAKQQAKTLGKLEQAHEVDKDIDKLTPDDKRDRLRNH